MAVSEQKRQRQVPYDEFRERLLNERQRLEDELGDFGVADAQAPPPGEVGYGNHPADYGTEVFEQEKELSIRRNFERQLEQVNAALQRMDEGAYGICLNCGRQIDPERLKALPFAEYCIDCAEQFSERLSL